MKKLTGKLLRELARLAQGGRRRAALRAQGICTFCEIRPALPDDFYCSDCDAHVSAAP